MMKYSMKYEYELKPEAHAGGAFKRGGGGGGGEKIKKKNH